MEKSNIKTVDDYMATLPEDRLVALEHVRQLILDLVPDAEETISYQIPIYKYHGHLVGFAAFKNHLSFAVCDGNILKTYENELKNFKTAPSMIRFSPEKPIPDALLTELILQRAADNLAKAAAKKKK
jgi:uncharacterized protein YdhG (YjbR/CyaY superfamily)